MFKKYCIVGLMAAFTISSCQVCSTCEIVDPNTNEALVNSEEFCSEDKKDVDAFESSKELEATTLGGVVSCSR